MKLYFHLNLEGFSNCYVIVNEKSREAIIIDPGQITTEIINHIEIGGYKLTGVLIVFFEKLYTTWVSKAATATLIPFKAFCATG